MELVVLFSLEDFNKKPVPAIKTPTISQIIVASLLKGAKRVTNTMKDPIASRRFPTWERRTLLPARQKASDTPVRKSRNPRLTQILAY